MKLPFITNPITLTFQSLATLAQKAPTVITVFFLVSFVFAGIGSFGTHMQTSLIQQQANEASTKGMTLVEYNQQQQEEIAAPENIAVIVKILPVLLFGILTLTISFILMYTYVNAIATYASVESHKGNQVSVKQAIKNVNPLFFGYLKVQLLVMFATIAWSLLFILPGIYKYTRYSLAGVAYFQDPKKNSGLAALDTSIDLTDKRFIHTANANLIPQILLPGFVIPAAITNQTRLYIQYTQLEDSEAPQPTTNDKIIFTVFVIAIAAALLYGLVVLALQS